MSATILLAPTLMAACTMGSDQPTEGEYYQAYMSAQMELEEMGIQLDSTLVRIRDLEGAIELAQTEMEGAEASAREAQLIATRDGMAAEYHALQAQERLTRARAVLSEVHPQ